MNTPNPTQIAENLDPSTFKYEYDHGSKSPDVGDAFVRYIDRCADEMDWSDPGDLVLAMEADIDTHERVTEALGFDVSDLFPDNDHMTVSLTSREMSFADFRDELAAAIIGDISDTWYHAFNLAVSKTGQQQQ